MLVCAASAAGTGYMYSKRAEHDKETNLAYPFIGHELAVKKLTATQLFVNVEKNEFNFVAYEKNVPFTCEGKYDYDGTTITVRFDELSCEEATDTQDTRAV
jgi:hypothetical protein